MAAKEKPKKKTATKKKEKEIKAEVVEEVIADDPIIADDLEVVPEVEVAEVAEEGAEGVKRGRAVKEPPPPKNWRVEGFSPEGIRVILGRFVTREEAEPELERLKEDGFYEKIRLVEAPTAPKA